MYLTYEEYKEFPYSDLSESEFLKLEKVAGDAMDGVTRHFYLNNNFETDITFRKLQFKKAVAAQIHHMSESGAVSASDLSGVVTMSIGRTSLSIGSMSGAGAQSNDTFISPDVYSLLSGTGLLNRGVSQC